MDMNKLINSVVTSSDNSVMAMAADSSTLKPTNNNIQKKRRK